jgi:hypothetical protein
MKQIKNCSLFVLAAILVCAGIISGANAWAAMTNPCVQDIAKYCPDAKPGQATIQCLETNENNLTPECRAYEMKLHGKKGEMKEQVAEQQKFRRDCADDILLFCKDVDLSKTGYIGCLNMHDKELSAPCARSVRQIKATKE